MNLDEVYQAALAAGSGGIRWNSTTNWIQLADENKNWIDYKRFNPNRGISLIDSIYNSNRSGNQTSTITCQNEGLYLVLSTLYGTYNISSTGNIIRSQAFMQGNYIIFYTGLVYANQNDTITLNTVNTSTGDTTAGKSFYYLRGYSTSTSLSGKAEGSSSNQTLNYGYNDGIANFICGACTAWNARGLQINGEFEGSTIIIDSSNGGYQSFVAFPDSLDCSFTIASGVGASSGYSMLGIAYGTLS